MYTGNGPSPVQYETITSINDDLSSIGSSNNGSTHCRPPGLLHTLGAGGHIQHLQWIKTECILSRIVATKSMFDVANMPNHITVKEVSDKI